MPGRPARPRPGLQAAPGAAGAAARARSTGAAAPGAPGGPWSCRSCSSCPVDRRGRARGSRRPLELQELQRVDGASHVVWWLHVRSPRRARCPSVRPCGAV